MTPSILTPLDGTPKDHGPYLTFDLESKAGMTQRAGFTRPFLAGIYDGSEYQAFRDSLPPEDEDSCWSDGGCVDKAMRYLLRKRYLGHIVYAHNGGRFDFLFLMPWLQLHGYEWEVVPLASGILQLKVWKPGTTASKRKARGKCWRFIDSLRLIPTSLKKAAITFGVTLKGELEYDTHENDPRWEVYNRLDCIALHEVLGRFFHYIEARLGGEVGITLPATAMRLYRRRYLDFPIERSRETHAFIRDSYYGGRVEVFQERGECLHYYDINSSYAAAMLQDVPVGPARKWRGHPHPRFLEGRHIGFVHCRVSVPRHLNIPPLPLRWNRKLVFPVGEFEGVWEWGELSHALSLGCHVVSWHQSVWYRAAPALASYAEAMYKERHRDGDPGRAYVGKMLLTNLYGKFGQRVERDSLSSRAGIDGPAEFCDEHDTVARVKRISDAPYIIPQIAARITALARVALDKWMREAMRRCGTVYYCDTDSIVTDVELPTSSELGALKEEYPEWGGSIRGRFLAPKMYYLEADEVYGVWESLKEAKAKGLQKDLKTVDTLKALESGTSLTQQRLEKVGLLARAGFQRGPRMLAVPRVWRGYDASKRIHVGDGTTRPIELPLR